MVKPGSYPTGLLLAVLLLQALLTPALCLGLLSQRPMATVICTPDGPRPLPAPGRDEWPAGLDEPCPALVSLSAPPPLAAPDMPAPRQAATDAAWSAVAAAGQIGPALALPFRSTGPPLRAA